MGTEFYHRIIFIEVIFQVLRRGKLVELHPLALYEPFMPPF